LISKGIRGEHRINIPDGQTMIYPGDYIDVIGDDEHVTKFSHRMEAEVIEMAPNDPLHKLTLRRMLISENAPFINKNLVESGIRDVYHCMLVGFESNNDNSISIADSQQIIRQGDTIWLVGEESSVEHLIQLNQGVSSPA
jgi:CPA2 family monovalent cation:H+ antiporter-2